MDWVIEGCERWFAAHGGDAMDFAMSTAVADSGKLNHLHDPCLAEHRIRGVASTLRHIHKTSSTSAGIYREQWRR